MYSGNQSPITINAEKAIATIFIIRFAVMPDSLHWICSIKAGITLNTNNVVEDG